MDIGLSYSECENFALLTLPLIATISIAWASSAGYVWNARKLQVCACTKPSYTALCNVTQCVVNLSPAPTKITFVSQHCNLYFATCRTTPVLDNVSPINNQATADAMRVPSRVRQMCARAHRNQNGCDLPSPKRNAVLFVSSVKVCTLGILCVYIIHYVYFARLIRCSLIEIWVISCRLLIHATCIFPHWSSRTCVAKG